MFKWLFRKPAYEDERLRGWKYAEKYLVVLLSTSNPSFMGRITETWTEFDTGIRDYLLERHNGNS